MLADQWLDDWEHPTGKDLKVSRSTKQPCAKNVGEHDVEQCSIKDCCYCKFSRNASKWQQLLTLPQEDAMPLLKTQPVSWLAWDGGAGCLCCRAAKLPGSWATFSITSQLCKMKRHQKCALHQAAASASRDLEGPYAS